MSNRRLISACVALANRPRAATHAGQDEKREGEALNSADLNREKSSVSFVEKPRVYLYYGGWPLSQIRSCTFQHCHFFLTVPQWSTRSVLLRFVSIGRPRSLARDLVPTVDKSTDGESADFPLTFIAMGNSDIFSRNTPISVD